MKKALLTLMLSSSLFASYITSPSSSSSAVWGLITGTLSNQTDLTSAISTASGLVENLGVTIQTPAAATIPLGIVDFAATVVAARTKCEVGSLTAKFQICHSGSCADITSCSAVSVTTGIASTSCTAARTVAAGDYLQVIVSSPSSASYCQLGVKMTR